MKHLFKCVQVLDSQSTHNGKTVDILVEDGIIAKVAEEILENGETHHLDNAIVTPGLVDLFSLFGDPGLEYKENCLTGSSAAISGGFTDVCVFPNTQPVIDSKSYVEYIKGRDLLVDLLPVAAISEGTRGENLTEILDLNDAGAVAFSDGTETIWNSELLLKALQYLSKFDGLVIQRARDKNLSQFAQMHEGLISTQLGMRGEPGLSEELVIKRDLDILRYAGGRIHFSQLSTGKSVELIRNAKAEGLSVTADVGINHLVYTHDQISDFNTHFKLSPPLRTEEDRQSLIEGVRDGSIDTIVSAHNPQDLESKKLEFDLAEFGAIGLQTVFSLLMKVADELPLPVALRALTEHPRAILGLEPVKVGVGSLAKLSFFNKEDNWELNDQTNKSRSTNSTVFGEGLKGRCVGVFNGSSFILN